MKHFIQLLEDYGYSSLDDLDDFNEQRIDEIEELVRSGSLVLSEESRKYFFFKNVANFSFKSLDRNKLLSLKSLQKPKTTKNYLEYLPIEITNEIFKSLQGNDIKNLFLVSKA